MTTINFYLDFISPYAYLAFEALPKTLKGCSYEVRYKPILFGALLQHHGQLGPAEFAPKRDWTYRQVLWLAQQLQVPLDMPAAHPFNPIALLRLALGAASVDDLPSRRVCEQIFHHVWRGGAQATDPDRLAALQAQLEKQGHLRRDPQSPEVKDQLKRLTQEAMDAGVFGVPTLEVDGKLFWGLDALPMLRDYLQNDAWFQGPAWDGVSQVEIGIERKR